MFAVQNNERACQAHPARGLVHGPGKDVTHWGGQSVPLRRRHKAVALTAVGSRCSEVTGTGLRGHHHSSLLGLYT